MSIRRIRWVRWLPLAFALLLFGIALYRLECVGWRSDTEKNWDLFIGFPVAILRGEGYRECPVDGYLWCDPSIGRQAYRLPGYPLFLTALFGAFGTDDPLPKIRLAQAALLGLLAFLATRYTYRLAGFWAALAVGMFLVLDQAILYWVQFVLSEMLFYVLVMLVIYAWTFYKHRPFWLGVLLALTLLTKGTLIFAAPLLLLFVPWRTWWRFALGFGLIIGAWTIRNYLVLGSFIPFSTGSGAVLWGANNPIAWAKADGGWLQMPDYPGYARFAGLPEAAWDRAQQSAALDYVRAQPVGKWLAIAMKKVELLFADNSNLYPTCKP